MFLKLLIGACSCLLTLAAPYNGSIIELFYIAKYYNLFLSNDINKWIHTIHEVFPLC